MADVRAAAPVTRQRALLHTGCIKVQRTLCVVRRSVRFPGLLVGVRQVTAAVDHQHNLNDLGA